MDMELFEKWFSRLFLCCAPGAWPLLLLLDSDLSHYSPAAIRMAAEVCQLRTLRQVSELGYIQLIKTP